VVVKERGEKMLVVVRRTRTIKTRWIYTFLKIKRRREEPAQGEDLRRIQQAAGSKQVSSKPHVA
jgi:hypothetical protein